MPETTAARTARMLLEVEAVLFRPERPFIFTSGWASPVYIDCRKLIAYPRLRARLMALAVEQLADTVGSESFDVVAGGETAGIPFAAWLADALMLPMAYVRKQPKGFGRNAKIEGRIAEGQRVLLVEDLTTDGRSKIAFADALREAGGVVQHAFCIFFYDIYPGSRLTLGDAGLTLHALATWADVLAAARRDGALPPAVLDEVGRFLDDPIAWSAAHGGAA